MPDDDQKLSERLMVQLSPRDLRQLQAVAEEMDRPLSWVARRGIRYYLAALMGMEEALEHGNDLAARMRERHLAESGEDEAGG